MLQNTRYNVSKKKFAYEEELKRWFRDYAIELKLVKYMFFIETEETVRGFPDAICVDFDNTIIFVEFKFSSKYRDIVFRNDQVVFWSKHKDVPYFIVYYDSSSQTVIVEEAAQVFSRVREKSLRRKAL